MARMQMGDDHKRHGRHPPAPFEQNFSQRLRAASRRPDADNREMFERRKTAGERVCPRRILREVSPGIFSHGRICQTQVFFLCSASLPVPIRNVSIQPGQHNSRNEPAKEIDFPPPRHLQIHPNAVPSGTLGGVKRPDQCADIKNILLIRLKIT